MDAEKPAQESGSGGGGVVPPFLSKCYEMVDDRATDSTVSWGKENNSFVIWDPHTFSRDLLPKYFKHSNLSSFVRQLNTYGFRKVDPDRWEFANEGFLRGQKHLLKTIMRRKPAHGVVQQLQSQKKNASVSACVEVGKFGLDEEIEILKRDKNLLMQELVKLRQHQQDSDLKLQSVTHRLQVMEQNQKQMMSLLAMAVQNPAFLAQLMQQSGNNRWRTGSHKRRRLPPLEQGVTADLDAASDGQIVRYQPLMNEVFNSAMQPELNEPQLGDLQQISNNPYNYSTMAKPIGTNPADMIAEYLNMEQLIASPSLENSELNDLQYFMMDDFELPEQEIEMEEPHNVVPPDGHTGGNPSEFETDANHKIT